MGALVETLNKIASLELKQSSREPQLRGIDLVETLSDLRIVLDPYCQEADVAIHWNIPRNLPPVWADRQRLLQVLLNLTKNSERALEHVTDKVIDISVTARKDGVSVRITDSGPGIAKGQKLFQPLQKGADATGLGLYLSRAFMRSFRGDLRHDPDQAGCCFLLELSVAAAPEEPSLTTELSGEHAHPAPTA